MVDKFRIVYELTDKVDAAFEKNIVRAMQTQGYSVYGSGFNVFTKMRDVAFEKASLTSGDSTSH